MANTHFSGPVLYSGANTNQYFAGMAEMPIGVNLAVFSLLDDFIGVAFDSTNDWTVVKDSGASVGIVADTVGGEVALTSTATTDNDGASIQGNEIFAVAASTGIFFSTRIKCNDADQTDICVGLTVNFATDPEAMLTAADRIVFQVDDGNASILCKTEKNGTETSTDSGVDLADNTYVVLSFNVLNTGSVTFYVNGKQVAQHTTNIPDDENLTIAAMSLSGSASGTRATTLDYIMAAQTR
jgi:hypothetical protein